MKVKSLRWVVLSLIAIVTIINYLDRGTLNYMWVANIKQVYPITQQATNGSFYALLDSTNGAYILTDDKGVVETISTAAAHIENNEIIYLKKGGIAKELGLVDPTLSDDQQQKAAKELLAIITMCFMVAYGISQLLSGKIYDKIGTRKGFAFSALLWGAADAFTSLSTGLKSLTGFRMMLGLGEAGPWPGTTKSNAEWFPVRERALAQGIFGAAASVGSVLAPIIIPLLFLAFGWKMTFIVVGSLGILWVIPWLIINKKSPKDHPWITDQERDYILSGQPESKLKVDVSKTWSELLRNRKNYAVILGRFFLDPIWWMFVTWLPIYLTEVFELDIKQIAITAWVPYVGAAIGSIAGGWFSGLLMKKGKSLNFARKTAMVVGALIIIPSMGYAAIAPTPTVAVILMAFILGGYQFMMTNIQTLASDLHTGKTVGSLAGIGGAAAVLGVLCTMYLVPLITTNGNWIPFFIMAGAMVPLSLGAIFICAGKIAPLCETENK